MVGLGEYRDKNGLSDSGCLFDWTHRRISVSNHFLCLDCERKLTLLENSIIRIYSDVHLVREINEILSGDWMGDVEKRNTPFYNLKKIYKYDVERNSGFNKGNWEKIRDSILDKSVEWTVGTIITGVSAAIASVIVYLLFGIKN